MCSKDWQRRKKKFFWTRHQCHRLNPDACIQHPSLNKSVPLSMVKKKIPVICMDLFPWTACRTPVLYVKRYLRFVKKPLGGPVLLLYFSARTNSSLRNRCPLGPVCVSAEWVPSGPWTCWSPSDICWMERISSRAHCIPVLMCYISLSPAYWWGHPVPKPCAYACKDLRGCIGKT